MGVACPDHVRKPCRGHPASAGVKLGKFGGHGLILGGVERDGHRNPNAESLELLERPKVYQYGKHKEG